MWSYVKIPIVPNESCTGVVCLEKYFVREGDVIKKGDPLALAHTEITTFKIVSNYNCRLLKLILSEKTMVGYRDAIATIELLQDPIDGLLIERCEVVNVE